MSAARAPIPVPVAVLDFKARQFPQHVRDAVLARADAERIYRLCRTPFTYEARECAISRMARAAKVLAALPRCDFPGGAL